MDRFRAVVLNLRMLRNLSGNIIRAALLAVAAIHISMSGVQAQDRPKLRVLLVTGGCCHNYTFQTMSLINGTRRFAEIDWTIAMQGGYGTTGKAPFYSRENWGEGFDLVIHNECFANTNDEEYVKNITEVHKAGLPAIVIHCAMHTYRAADFDDWRQFLGVTSRHHEHQSRYPTRVLKPDHPTMQGFPADWVSPKDELYVIEKVWPNTTPLVLAKSEKDDREHPVFWVSDYGKARVFGTTFGHTDETFSDKVFLDTLGRAMLWVTEKKP